MTLSMQSLVATVPYKKPMDLAEYFAAVDLGYLADGTTSLGDQKFRIWVLYYLIGIWRQTTLQQQQFELFTQAQDYTGPGEYRVNDTFHELHVDVEVDDSGPTDKWFGDPHARKLGFIAFGRWDETLPDEEGEFSNVHWINFKKTVFESDLEVANCVYVHLFNGEPARLRFAQNGEFTGGMDYIYSGMSGTDTLNALQNEMPVTAKL